MPKIVVLKPFRYGAGLGAVPGEEIELSERAATAKVHQGVARWPIDKTIEIVERSAPKAGLGKEFRIVLKRAGSVEALRGHMHIVTSEKPPETVPALQKFFYTTFKTKLSSYYADLFPNEGEPKPTAKSPPSSPSPSSLPQPPEPPRPPAPTSPEDGDGSTSAPRTKIDEEWETLRALDHEEARQSFTEMAGQPAPRGWDNLEEAFRAWRVKQDED